MQQIKVVHKGDLAAGDSTPGIVRERATDDENAVVSRSRVGGGVVSAWHHHGRRRRYGYLVSGRLRLEYGPGGKEVAEVKPGDFFFIPPACVHRDVNPDAERELVVVNFLVGQGTPVVNVPGPQS